MKKTLSTLVIALAFTAPTFADKTNLPPDAEKQKAYTPATVLQELMEGNKRFMAGELKDANVQVRIEATSKAQFPKAYILSCVDSRVPVEQVFDRGIGDVFVGRVAGNIESIPQLGSMEFATKAAGAKLVMVLGHEACGAVKGACDHVELGNLTALLGEISPAVDAVDGFEEAERTSKNEKFVAAVVEENVRKTVRDLRERSEVLSQLEKDGEIMIVGALYCLNTGEVIILDGLELKK